MKKKLNYLLILILTIILMPFNVKAINNIKLNVDKTILKPGEVVTITIDIESNTSLYDFMTRLSFDENIFIPPQIDNFKEQSMWSDIVYNEENKKFALLNKKGENNSHLLVLNLTVKDNPVAGNTTISLINSLGSDGTQDIKFNDEAKTITILKTDKTTTESSYIKDDSTENDKSSKTFKSFIIVGITLAIILAISIIIINLDFINKHIFIEESKKKMNIILSVLLGIILLTTITLSFIHGYRGDVNGDGKKDYNDTKKINEYLIDITNEEDKDKYDVNGDGKITITDAAKNTKDATKNTKYKVTLDTNNNDIYATHDSEVKLMFTSKISPNNVDIKAVYLNNQKLDVHKDNNSYYVDIKAPSISGVHNYKITKVVLTNGREISINALLFRVEVLKEKPQITKVNYNSEDKALVFELEDPDKVLTEVYVRIIKGEVSYEDANTIINSDKLTDDFLNNELVFDQKIDLTSSFIVPISLDVGCSYTLLVRGDYDLDTNTLDSNSNYYQNEDIYFNSFANGQVTIIPLTNLDSLYPLQNQKLTFEFDIEVKPLTLSKTITQVMLDGTLYNVSYTNNHYAFTIDNVGSYGEKRHFINMVILSDGTKVLCDYELVYDVLKNIPQITSFLYHDKEQKITFTLDDLDSSLEEAKIIVSKKDDNTVVFSSPLDISKINHEFSLNLDKGSKYDVVITGTYDLDSQNNGLNDYSGPLFNHELTIYDVVLNYYDEDTYYVEKGSNATLTFTSLVVPEDKMAVITSVVINDEVYYPNHYEDGSYSVSVTPQNVGRHSYEITKVILDDDEIDKSLIYTVDVLKDKPTIKNLYVDETSNNTKITFTIEDIDNALLSDVGELIIKNSAKEQIKSFKLNKGNNIIDLESIKEQLVSGTFYFDIKLNYDLDSDLNNNKYTTSEYVIKDHRIIIYKVNLSVIDDNQSFKKEETKKIHINADIICDSNIDDQVMIKYFVMRDGTKVSALYDNMYYMNLTAPKISGEHTYYIDKVVLSNDVLVNVSLFFTIDVLKDIPYVNRLNLNGTSSISYELTDLDNAFISGEIYIEDKDKTNVKVEPITNCNQKEVISYAFQEDTNYTINIIGNYNLSNNENQDYDYENTKIYTYSFLVGGEYNFTLNDVMITDTITKDEKPVITFTSTNNREAKIKSITINNKEYDVIDIQNNKYQVILDKADMDYGKHKVIINKIQLDTLKVYENNKDYYANNLTYTVLKDAPMITDIILTSNKDDKTITASYNLEDNAFTLNKLVAILLDSSNRIIDSKVISTEEVYISHKTTLSYDKNMDGKYIVRFLGDYDLGSKYKYISQNLNQEEIFIENNDIYIKDIILKKSKYVTKGQKNYEISYDLYVGPSIKTNNNKNYTRVSMININGVNYVATQESGYKSKVGITIPNKAGVITLTSDKVQLELNSYYDKVNNYYSVNSKSIQIEVLKDAPSIDNLIIKNEDYDKGLVTFAFDVIVDSEATSDDQSFINGSIELGEEKHSITRGHNEVTFTNVKVDTDFALVFKASYDLDTDTLNYMGVDENEFTNQQIYQTQYGLYDDSKYENISITYGRAISNDNDIYFEKNEDIKLNLDIFMGDLSLYPKKVIIQSAEYLLSKVDDKYQILLDGYNTFGQKEINITDIILSNGKDVKLKEPYKINLEVLKDAPEIINFKYNVSKDDINLTSTIKDLDHAFIKEPYLKVRDEDGNIIYEGIFNESIKLNKNKDILRYYIEVKADYDRDIDITPDSSNYYKDITFIDEIISLENHNISLKDIIDINLYKVVKTDMVDEVDNILQDTVDINDLKKNLDKYFVEVNMESMPSIHSLIKEVKIENKQLVLTLDYKYVTNEEEKISVIYGSIDDNIATNETHPSFMFTNLLIKLRNGEDVILDKDYDAKDVLVDDIAYVDNFSSTLDGNGHTIKNLSKPLFNQTNNAVIKNLILKDVTMPSVKGNGTLSITDNSSTIEGVIISNYYKANSENQVGTIIGNAIGTHINMCGATNFNINSGYANRQQLGGLVGSSTNVVITNSYAIGLISGGWNFRGGMTGRALGKSTYENNYVAVNIDYSMGNGLVCGFACDGGNSIFKNNLSLSYGSIGQNKIYGGALESENNYYVSSSLDTPIVGEGIHMITSEDIDTSFFQKQLHFDKQIWNLQNISVDNLPTLSLENKSSVNGADNADYDINKEVLYRNLTKLMPYYDSKTIISIAKKVNDDLLNQDEIVHIVPINKDGNIVTYLTNDDVKKISQIKIVYKTGKKATYKVIYDNTYDMVASYRIPSLKIDYNYKHYIIDADSQVVNNLTNYLMSLDYTSNLDTLTSTIDSRIYRDFYNDVTSKELKEFVLKLLSNSNYTNIINNENINSYIEENIKKNSYIEKILYMYNYFRRFYDLDIDGMKLYDFMLFNMEGFDSSLTPIKIADLYLADGNNFNTALTGSKYATVLSGYTKKDNIANFISYMVSSFGTTDLDEWTRGQFKGYLVEVPVVGHEEDIQYTLWNHFINEDKSYPARSYDIMLPILTLPQNAAYIISSPVQFIIGAQRTYIKNPFDANEQAILQNKVNIFADRLKNYFTTAYKILEDATLFNNIHTIHHDKRYAYDENEVKVYQQVGTEEPFHKNFNEVTGRWQTSDGNNAVAWGDRIDWSVAGVLDSDLKTDGTLDVGHVTYKTWSHETAHNIDARLFLRGNGRRFDAGGEDYADSNLMQSFGPNDIVMNLSIYFNDDIQIGSSKSPDTIASKDKIYSYYNKLFETIYVIDYLEAQAFLQLSNEDKAEIGIQVTYPNEERYQDEGNKYRARQTSLFSQLTSEEWAKMNLQTIDDLIDNHIMKYTGIYQKGSRGSNSYGGEGINIAHWYQPSNPDGRPDSYAIKWIAYEMLGYKGYDEGYVEYYSNIHSERRKIYKNIDNPSEGWIEVDYKSDAMALNRITNGEFDNFDDYKKARFAQTKANLPYLKDIDINYYVQKLYDAMVLDSAYAKTRLNELLNAYHKDVSGCLNDYWCRNSIANDVRAFPNSTKVRQEILYKLKTLTNDFTESIFAPEIQSEVLDFKLKKENTLSINNTIEEVMIEDVYLAPKIEVIDEKETIGPNSKVDNVISSTN